MLCDLQLRLSPKNSPVSPLTPSRSAPGRLCGEAWLVPAFRLRIKEDTQAPQRGLPCITPGPAWTRCLEELRSTLFPDRPPGRTKDAEQQGGRDDIYSLPGFLIEAPCPLLPSPSGPFLQEAPDYLGGGASTSRLLSVVLPLHGNSTPIGEESKAGGWAEGSRVLTSLPSFPM